MTETLLAKERIAELTERLHTGKAQLTADRQAQLVGYLTTASDLVLPFLGEEWATVPNSVLDQALLTVAREIETREKSPGGVFAAFGEHDQGVRLARDPLTLAYPLLRPYIGGGFA